MFDILNPENDIVNANSPEMSLEWGNKETIDQSAITQIRASLSSISNSHSTWDRIAAVLRSYFGKDIDGTGLRLFQEWIAKRPHPDNAEIDNLDSKAIDVWIEHVTSDGNANVRGRDPEVISIVSKDPRTRLTDLILHLGYLRTLAGPAIYWPDQTRGSRYPNPRSQPNIEAFIAASGVTLYRNEFTGRAHIEGFEGFAELSDQAIEALWLRAIVWDSSLAGNISAASSATLPDATAATRSQIISMDWSGTVHHA